MLDPRFHQLGTLGAFLLLVGLIEYFSHRQENLIEISDRKVIREEVGLFLTYLFTVVIAAIIWWLFTDGTAYSLPIDESLGIALLVNLVLMVGSLLPRLASEWKAYPAEDSSSSLFFEGILWKLLVFAVVSAFCAVLVQSLLAYIFPVISALARFLAIERLSAVPIVIAGWKAFLILLNASFLRLADPQSAAKAPHATALRILVATVTLTMSIEASLYFLASERFWYLLPLAILNFLFLLYEERLIAPS